MKKIFFAVILTALFTTNAQADTVGLYIGGQIWQSETSGIFGEESQLIDFNLNKEQQVNYFVAIEHPLPLLPNIRISSTTLDTTGEIKTTEESSFVDPASLIVHNSHTRNDVNASFNVSYIDYSLYYELFDTDLFLLDFGVSARYFNDTVTVTEATTTVNTWEDIFNTPYTATFYETSEAKIKIDEILPMLYLASQFNIPLTNLSVFAQGNFSLVTDHSLSDYQVGLSYRLIKNRMGDFNLTLGYRAVRMEFEDLDNLYTDLEFKGAFFGAIAHF